MATLGNLNLNVALIPCHLLSVLCCAQLARTDLRGEHAKLKMFFENLFQENQCGPNLPRCSKV